MVKPHLVVGALALGLIATGAQAQETTFKFSGFGTLAATKSSEKNADFTANFAQPNVGPGFSKSVDFGVDSRLGLQGDVRFGEQFSFVAQVIAEHRYDDTYTPYLNMAAVKFQITPSLAIRGGRIPFSAYVISEYKKVGYAMPWVRPPVEVYQFNPLSYVDGADLLWQANAGDISFAGQFMAGSTDADLPTSNGVSKFKGKSLGAASVKATYGSASFRVFHLQMKSTLDNTGLDSPTGYYALMRIPNLGPPYFNALYNPALADQFQIKGDKTTYTSVGFNFDPGDWFLMAEGAKNAGDENQLLHATAYYATVGIRFGNWTPYLTVASKTMDSPTTNAHPFINGIAADGNHAQSSTSAGLRWDFMSNLALKVQFDAVKNATGSPGALVNQQPGFKLGESYNLISIALDFVF